MSVNNPYTSPNPQPVEDPPLVARLAVDGEGMTVEFEQTLDDLLEVQYFLLRELGFKMPGRPVWICLALSAVILLMLTLLSAMEAIQQDLLILWVPMLFVVGCVALLIPCTVWNYRWNTRRLINKLANKGRNYNLIGLRRVTITPEFLVYASPVSQAASRWLGLERVVVEGQHLFIFISNLDAVILPRRAFNSTQHFQEFAQQAAKYLAAGIGGSPPPAQPNSHLVQTGGVQ